MKVTRRGAAAILDPPMTARQVAALIVIAGIPALGVAHKGKAGRPPVLYDYDAIIAAHAAEAVRTAKQFTDNDWIASALLSRGLITADPAAGTLRWPDGSRAETMTADIYGLVAAGPEKVMAHRVIWIAADGEIPPCVQVNHVNRLRWDNRRANLELVTWLENIRHASGKPYLTRADAAAELAALPVDAGTLPVPAESLMRAGGAFRHLNGALAESAWCNGRETSCLPAVRNQCGRLRPWLMIRKAGRSIFWPALNARPVRIARFPSRSAARRSAVNGPPSTRGAPATTCGGSRTRCAARRRRSMADRLTEPGWYRLVPADRTRLGACYRRRRRGRAGGRRRLGSGPRRACGGHGRGPAVVTGPRPEARHAAGRHMGLLVRPATTS